LASANEIPPGGEGKINVHVSTGRSSRKIRQIVRVITNDPKNPEVRLTVTADVQADLEVFPRDLLQFEGKEPAKARVVLKNNTNAPVELSAITSSNKQIKVSVSSMTIPANGEIVLIGELLSDFPAGVIEGWVEIKSNLKSRSVIRLQLWRRIED
jgi:hypothetical protein